MKQDWTEKLLSWWQGRTGPRAARRSSSRGPSYGAASGALISHLEVLESRRLLTNLIHVTVEDGAIRLVDQAGRSAQDGDAFQITFTATQVTLTGTNGTQFEVAGQKVSTYTAAITQPVSISMHLHSRGNTVSVTGDGTASLKSLSVNFGHARGDNSLNLTKVIADSISIRGGRGNDSVNIVQSTVRNNLSAELGFRSGDLLDLDRSTVEGNVRDTVSQLVIDHSTISGSLNSRQFGRNSSFKTIASTYDGAVTLRMGGDSVIGMYGSPEGPNRFNSSQTVIGLRRYQTTIYQASNSVVNAESPRLRNVNVTQLSATFTPPTVTPLAAATNTPIITGTYDSVKSPVLTVAVNGKTYKLGTDSQLTSPSAGKWSLNLSGAPLTARTTTVTATSYDVNGNKLSGTGTVTNEQFIIDSYLTANNLTATRTATGLTYVITTAGGGEVPTNGQTVKATYTGYVLNSDGTQGTQFDSNTTTGFSFVLGAGTVIKGWDEAFKRLPVGTSARLLIPSSLAYGTGSRTNIPANSILIFDVTLVSAV
ncbi:FKBP-type peptidyl-prolyl cis-trans isomerase [Schlesneria sp.]|uniref:FKBP-type peptidyl-prolyl cis-trans isomerase n=1 Tax=Schlesneria sp. TaxID=2762018 RepID=UPI002EFE7FFE